MSFARRLLVAVALLAACWLAIPVQAQWTLPASAPAPLLRLHKESGVTVVNDANGRARVSSWVDSVGGFDFTQATAANRPYRYGIAGFWNIVNDGILFDYDPATFDPYNFASNAKNILASSAAGISLNSRSFTLLMVLQAHADRSSLASSDMCPLIFGTTSGGGAPFYITETGGSLRNRAARNYSGSFTVGTITLPITKIPVLVTGNASGYTINVAGTKFTTTANANSTLVGMTLGAFVGFESATGFKGAIHELIAFQTSIYGDDAKQADLINGAMAAHNIGLGEMYAIVGDSRAHGAGLDTMAGWPKLVRWPNDAVVYGFHYPGETATDGLSFASQQTTRVVSQLATYRRRTLIVDVKQNDLSFTVSNGGVVSNTGAGVNWDNETLATLHGVTTYQSMIDAYNRVKAICDQAYTDGYDRVWVTAQHATEAFYVGGPLTKRVAGWLAFNQLLRAGKVAGDFDELIPVDTLPQLATPTDTTYFRDTFHPNRVGHQVQAAMIQRYVTPNDRIRGREYSGRGWGVR